MKTILDTQKANNNASPWYKRHRLAVVVTVPVLLLAGWYGTASDQGGKTVEADRLQIATVTRGALVKDVRAPGNLVSNERMWLSARINARVKKRLLEPGAAVDPDSIIVTLDAPGLVQEYKQAQLALKVAEAQLDALKEQQQTRLAEQQADVSLLAIEKKQAIEDLQAKSTLRTNKIIPEFQYTDSVLRREKLTRELEIEQFKLAQLPRLQSSLLRVELAKVEQQQLAVALLAEQVDRLNVRAGMTGILQSLSVEEGQQVAMGSELARVASQDNLKAQLRVQESQIKEIRIGQTVLVDTRRSKLSGTVSRIDPAVVNGTVTVDVRLPSELPEEARPDLRVEGIVEIERLDDVLMVNKPANWSASKSNSGSAYLFKLEGESLAVKTPVQFGLSSVSSVQLLDGLAAGEKVILSDLTPFAQHQQLHIN